MSSDPLTTSDLLVASTQLLLDSGYSHVEGKFPEWNTSTTRLFEDRYSVVGLVVFDNAADLIRGWPDLQGSLVNVITRHIGQVESKAWDGYLVLMTSAIVPEEEDLVATIRYNTNRVRKVIGMGGDLQSLVDVERFLRPLLPLRIRKDIQQQESVLQILPELLAREGIPEDLTRTVVHAFDEQSSILDRLHQKVIKS